MLPGRGVSSWHDGIRSLLSAASGLDDVWRVLSALAEEIHPETVCVGPEVVIDVD